MSVQIRLPSSLRSKTGGAASVEVDASDVEGAIRSVMELHPGLRPHLCDDQGRLRSFVNVFVNEDNARDLEGLATLLAPGDQVNIVPSMAGG